MEQRINAVLNYCYRDDICREQYLVEYFGENSPQPCGHCDTCIEKYKRTTHTSKDVQDGILYMAQLKPRTLNDFIQTLSFPQDEIIDMVSMLVDEGYLKHLSDDTYLNPDKTI